MARYVLDACALINLHCGWAGLTELREFGEAWKIGSTAFAEALFVRDFDTNGKIVKTSLVASKVLAQSGLEVLSIEGAAEAASSLEFAMALDDGEAQALAFAFHRNLVLLTDDRLAIRLAATCSPAVVAVGTPEILMAWVASNPTNEFRLPEVVRRISVLGPFQLSKSSPNYLWWQELLNRSTP
jgi:predicted nucleic acid-binding protein